MKKLIAMLSLAASCGFAATFSGTVIDVMCKDKDAAAHTKDCALSCAKGGFGIVTSDGKFMKFDEKGNAKALAAIKATKKSSDLKATVKGTADGDVLKVDSIMVD
ncbi:MAG TPA: hypothetical protein VKU01_25295 [Bryobacteraceae bacterium]|nr:hypothetical protein [Bryobacteraceae bacterium]